MDAREALERRIDELCAENERLRGQVASLIGRSFRTADKMNCLNIENAKLRKELEAEHALAETLEHASEYEKMEAFVRLLAKIEALKLLCRDMRTCINHACYCEFCPMFVSEDMNERRCIADIMARMHELGIR